MKDLAGNELAAGDRVAVRKGGRYGGLHLSTVTRFTPKLVFVSGYMDRSIQHGEKGFEPRNVVKIVEPS